MVIGVVETTAWTSVTFSNCTAWPDKQIVLNADYLQESFFFFDSGHRQAQILHNFFWKSKQRISFNRNYCVPTKWTKACDAVLSPFIALLPSSFKHNCTCRHLSIFSSEQNKKIVNKKKLPNMLQVVHSRQMTQNKFWKPHKHLFLTPRVVTKNRTESVQKHQERACWRRFIFPFAKFDFLWWAFCEIFRRLLCQSAASRA